MTHHGSFHPFVLGIPKPERDGLTGAQLSTTPARGLPKRISLSPGKIYACDLQHLICALLAIREAGKVLNIVAEVLLRGCLEFDEKKQVLRLQSHIENPIAVLRTIVQIQKAVDYFT